MTRTRCDHRCELLKREDVTLAESRNWASCTTWAIYLFTGQVPHQQTLHDFTPAGGEWNAGSHAPATGRNLRGRNLPINTQRPFSDSETGDRQALLSRVTPWSTWKDQGCPGFYRPVILWATSILYVGLSYYRLCFCHLQIKEPRLKSSLAFYSSYEGRIL